MTGQTKPDPLASIIIPHHAGKDVLCRCLDSILAHTHGYPYEIILVDNGSTDGSIELATRRSREIQIIRLTENLGFAVACNRGIENAHGKYVVLLNDDVEVGENWLAPVIDFMESDESIGACQPKILSLANPKIFEYSGGAGGMIDIFGFPFAKGRLFDDVEEDTGQYDEPTRVFWASGVALFLRKDVVIEAGLLDELFVSYQEEIDLCWRLHLIGYGVSYVLESVVYHKGGFTLERKSVQRMFYNHRNNLIMLIKNLALHNLLWIFPIRLFLESGVIAGAAVRNRKRMIAEVLALGYLISHIPTITRKRREVQEIRRRLDSYVTAKQYKGFIALEYFVLGRKSVHELRGFARMMEGMLMPSASKTSTMPE